MVYIHVSDSDILYHKLGSIIDGKLQHCWHSKKTTALRDLLKTKFEKIELFIAHSLKV